MVFLYFLLDLRSLAPPLLRDVKQSLFQLANYYAVSRSKIVSKPLLDPIGICYLIHNRVACCDELKIAYNPHGNFNLRDLHHALNTLPPDAFYPAANDCDDLNLKLVDFLTEKVMIHSSACPDENLKQKVILITSRHLVTPDTVMMKTLMDAAEKGVEVEFILFGQQSGHNGETMENVDQFEQQLASLKSCLVQKCIPVPQVLHGLVKRWFSELKDCSEEPLQACFVFKTNLVGSVNRISCNLYDSINPVVDEFIYSQVCRCHGAPLEYSNGEQSNASPRCCVTNDQLGALDTTNSVVVNGHTVLCMPSFHSQPVTRHVSGPIEFNVVQRTNLTSLSEGLIMGATYYVSPSPYQRTEQPTDLNRRIFEAVCRFLDSGDDGLVCCSKCNVETSMETSFRCYYVLLPSHKGQMLLLRRLSASEEFLPFPVRKRVDFAAVDKSVDSDVQRALQKVKVGDYNPFMHERGLHQKLNFLVKESLQLRSTPLPKSETPELQITEKVVDDALIKPSAPPNDDDDDDDTVSIAEEWEQLLVTDLETTSSPKLIAASRSPPQSSNNSRELNEKTCRILERLEVPDKLKRKTAISISPSVIIKKKKPLIPFNTNDVAPPDHNMDSTPQPMKPNFQRSKKVRQSFR